MRSRSELLAVGMTVAVAKLIADGAIPANERAHHHRPDNVGANGHGLMRVNSRHEADVSV